MPSTTTPSPCSAPRSSPAAPTTSSPTPGIEKLLEDRGILYAPDYVVNAGGVIQVADEIHGFDFDRAKARATKIYDTTKHILELAAAEGIPPATAADRLAERRMADAVRTSAPPSELVPRPSTRSPQLASLARSCTIAASERIAEILAAGGRRVS